MSGVPLLTSGAQAMDVIRAVILVSGPAVPFLVLATVALPDGSRAQRILRAVSLRALFVTVVGLTAMPLQSFPLVGFAYDLAIAALLACGLPALVREFVQPTEARVSAVEAELLDGSEPSASPLRARSDLPLLPPARQEPGGSASEATLAD